MDNYKHENTLFEIADLIKKFILKELSPEEEKRLREWLKEDGKNQDYFNRFIKAEKINDDLASLEDIGVDEGWTLFQHKLDQKKKKVKVYQWLKYAAVFILLIGLATVMYFNFHHHRAAGSEDAIIAYHGANQHFHNDVSPGGKKALLTLANGKQIVLNKNAAIQLTEADSTHLVGDSSKLVYQGSAKSMDKVLYNTLETPVGGTYQLVLADGTKVWLNAKSSLKFPTSFVGNNRIVYLTGEAYFEVTKNPHRPFELQTEEGVNVKVLGTHFNVMAYPDEKRVVTSLLEGHVILNANNQAKQYDLLPGQAGVYNRSTAHMDVTPEDVNAAVAWKSGLFIFNNDPLSKVMRQLERWYGVEVQYEENQSPDMHFTGAVRMKENLSKVLQMLELTGGAKFTINERKIVVLK